jgi:hypothetical protein
MSSPLKMPFLALRNVTKTIGAIEMLHDSSLNVYPGEVRACWVTMVRASPRSSKSFRVSARCHQASWKWMAESSISPIRDSQVNWGSPPSASLVALKAQIEPHGQAAHTG